MRSHKQIHNQKQTYLILGIFAVVTLFLLFFGLPVLINLGSWIGAAARGDDGPGLREESFFGTIFVDDLPPATNSAELDVSGSVSGFDKVTFLVNGNDTKTIDVMDSDSFTERIDGLLPGDNSVVVVATNTGREEERRSEEYSVILKTEKPLLEITEPESGTETTEDDIIIRGSTDPDDTTIYIDGAPGVVRGDGSFEQRIRLSEGENRIEVIVTDFAGNEEKTEILITQKNP